MPNTKNNRKQKRNPRGKTARSGRQTAPSAQAQQVAQYATLLADPCNAALTAPQYGASTGGYLTRFSSHESIESSTFSSGYVVWFPDYTEGGQGHGTATSGNGNLYIFGGTTGNSVPINTDSSPFGSGSTYGSASGTLDEDPAFDFASSSVVQDTRTAAACIKLLYTGRTDECAGRVCYLNDIPRETLLTGNSGEPLSVNRLFRYSDHSMRMPLDLVENKFRPSTGSEYFRSPEIGLDDCFTATNTGGAETVIGSGLTTGSGLGIGFAWEGLTADSTLSLDLTKVLEWRPNMDSGLTAAPASVAPLGGNMVSRSIATLDHKFPGWQRKALQIAGSAASKVANWAWGGPENRLLKMAERAAPLLLTL